MLRFDNDFLIKFYLPNFISAFILFNLFKGKEEEEEEEIPQKFPLVRPNGVVRIAAHPFMSPSTIHPLCSTLRACINRNRFGCRHYE